MRHFSVAPPLTIQRREFHRLRGFAGKPFHPPGTQARSTVNTHAVITPTGTSR